MAAPTMKAKIVGTAITATSANGSDLKGTQKYGSAVGWFQSIKSGIPGVDWILVLATLDASSLRKAAMQYPPSPKNSPCPRLRIPVCPQHRTRPTATKA